MRVLIAICLSLLVLLGHAGAPAAPAAPAEHAAGGNPLDYQHQDRWVGVLDHAQSPIDIVTRDVKPAQANEPRAIELQHVQSDVGSTQDTGHAVQFNTHRTEATIRGRHVRLQQLHFHDPSEHTIDGRHFPLEGHFVFAAQDGRLAVVAVMYEAGAANSAIGPILDDLATAREAPPQRTLKIRALLPAKLGYYHYLGSLTTPPLTQNVEWYVLRQPVTMSTSQLEALETRYPRNNRAIQPLNGRPVIGFPG